MVQQHQQNTQKKAFRVRSYEPRDHAAIVDVYTAAIKQYPENRDQLQPNWIQLIQNTLTGDFADIEAAYFKRGGHFWVATYEAESDHDEQVVGIVAAKVEDRSSGDAELVRMFVHPAYHRCGIGRLLVTALENWVRDQGLERVMLSTAYAQHFYESLGYTFLWTKAQYVGFLSSYYEKRLVGCNK